MRFCGAAYIESITVAPDFLSRSRYWGRADSSDYKCLSICEERAYVVAERYWAEALLVVQIHFNNNTNNGSLVKTNSCPCIVRFFSEATSCCSVLTCRRNALGLMDSRYIEGNDTQRIQIMNWMSRPYYQLIIYGWCSLGCSVHPNQSYFHIQVTPFSTCVTNSPFLPSFFRPGLKSSESLMFLPRLTPSVLNASTNGTTRL